MIFGKLGSGIYPLRIDPVGKTLTPSTSLFPFFYSFTNFTSVFVSLTLQDTYLLCLSSLVPV